ncbi:MAG: prolipoprotein diacylglyceryl transferase [Chloroflexi bacterium RBG_16_48_8]|nr:MAG: prolipoprotein diacylglyceryl transferase [Chloroflexi bacterium RBG_16_48_8]
MTFDAYGIHLGPLYFRYYGMIIMFGAVCAAYLGRWLAGQMGEEDPDIAWDALIWALIFGIIGARIYHIFTPSQTLLDAGIDTKYYLTHPLDIITTWRGGLGMPGAIAGGVLGLYIYARYIRKPKLDIRILLDAAAPGVALAQAIGRWGNFVNQELYGPPTDLPWGIYIKPENRMEGYFEYERFHPLFLYESLWNLASMFFLIWLWRRYGDRMKRGDLFLAYLITYPLGRFLLEFIRLDYVPYFGINFNQALMFVVAIVAGVVLFLRHRKEDVPAENQEE